MAAIEGGELRVQVAAGIPWILAGFARVVRERSIPAAHYLAFLAAMRRDVSPRAFPDFPAVIEEYIYGSAIVVGYFLAHIYGSGRDATLADALDCARELGIALQLTNFARDVEQDRARGRLYVPADVLAREGLTAEEALQPAHGEALRRTARALAAEAEWRYEHARARLAAFHPESRVAIRACIDVYQAVNRRLLEGRIRPGQRARLNAFQKFQLLPAQKYWRVPLACARLL
ncbi:MAG: phytoene/squalene synthase family protein [Bryobacteraceae bacterium]